ncbi:urease accessory protein UreF [Harenicola maris]
MTTTIEVLTLAQLLSPSFPVGAFAYSNGLEAAIAEGRVTTAEQVQDWLEGILMHGSGKADAVLLNVAYRAQVVEVSEIDASARAFAASKERLLETDLQGAAFCETVAQVWGLSIERLTYPVALGRAARLLGLDAELTTAMYLQAFAGNLCAAAMRLVPLGQVDGQEVQLALKPICLEVAEQVKTAELDDLFSCAFASDISAMRHETQYSRVFRT